MILSVSEAGKLQFQVKLTSPSIFYIGREENNFGFSVTDQFSDVSRKHIKLEYTSSGKLLLTDMSSNGTYDEKGHPLSKDTPVALSNGFTCFRLGGQYLLQINIEGDSAIHTDNKPQELNTLRGALENNTKILIGRDPSCNLVIDEPMVSRFHAQIEQQGTSFIITDLNSTNGTYVNGLRITAPTPVNEQTEIFIGPVKYKLDTTENLSEKSIEAIGISRLYRKVVNGKEVVSGLNPVSFKAGRGEFIALMGPSSCGKTTLLKLLSNYESPNSGQILVFGEDIANAFNYDRLKHAIGYVQQKDDWLIPDLTVWQTMLYSAKLRLPDSTTLEQIQEIVKTVFQELNLNESFFPKKISELSGGAQKRIAIAVEMLSQPQILFLDEPTSPLDPETIDSFLHSIKKLAKNRLVIMVTHKPDDLKYVDRVLFLGTGGYHIFDGKPDALLQTFGKCNILELYKQFSNADAARAEWQKKYNRSSLPPSNRPFASVSGEGINSFFNQLYWLCVRYFRAKANSGFAVLALISIGLPLLAFSTITQLMITVPFMLVILTLFIGLFNSIQEILYDRGTYERERKINLRASTYYFSKFLVLLFFGVIQVLIIAGIAFLVFGIHGSIQLHSFVKVCCFLLLLMVGAIITGLLVSALSRQFNQAVYALLFILILQMMYGGTFAKLDVAGKEIASYFAYSRWGMQGIAHMHEKDTVLGKVYSYSPLMTFDTIAGVETIEKDTVIKDKQGRPVPTHITLIHDTVRLIATPDHNHDTLVAVSPLQVLGFYSDVTKYDNDKKQSTTTKKILPESMHNTRAAVWAIIALNLVLMIVTIAELKYNIFYRVFHRT